MKKIFATVLICLMFTQATVFGATEFTPKTTEKFQAMGLDTKTIDAENFVDMSGFVWNMTNLLGYSKWNFKSEVLASGEAGFKDCEGKWYYDNFKIASYLNIVEGDKDGNIKPATLVTEEDLVVLMCKTFAIHPSAKDKKTTFADDATIAYSAKPYVAYAFKKGYITPDDKNNFNPKRNITKGEMFTLADKFLGEVILTSGEYKDKTFEGNVTVIAKDVHFENVVIKGDLQVLQTAKEFKNLNVTVEGNVWN